MCLYDTRKALFYTPYNKFKDIIDNIIKSVDDLYSTFHRSLEKLEKDYEDVSKSSTYYEDGFYDEYEKERLGIYERLNIQLAGLLVILNSSFEDSLKEAFAGMPIRKPKGEAFYIPYCEYIDKKLNIKLSDDFLVSLTRFKNMRNDFGHSGVDLNTPDKKIKKMIQDMAVELHSLIKLVYDNLYNPQSR